MDRDTLWTLEEQFWTGGEGACRDTLDPDCIMAFPAPTGILADPGIAESLSGVPRCTRIEIAERRLARPGPELAVLGYRARGIREGAEPWRLLHLGLLGARRVTARSASADSDSLTRLTPPSAAAPAPACPSPR